MTNKSQIPIFQVGVKSVDKIVKEQETTRSAFTRQALREAVDKTRLKVLDHIQTVSKKKIGGLITVLSEQRKDELGEAIAFALNLYGKRISNKFLQDLI